MRVVVYEDRLTGVRAKHFSDSLMRKLKKTLASIANQRETEDFFARVTVIDQGPTGFPLTPTRPLKVKANRATQPRARLFCRPHAIPRCDRLCARQ
jgi:hypothetical protein